MADKKAPPTLAVNHHPETGKGHYIAFPREWVDRYFAAQTTYTNRTTGEKICAGMRTPASFWKYTLHLWRWLSIPREVPKDSGNWIFRTEIAADQFPVRSDAAVQWTNAYAASGVVKVSMGRWTAQHDQPTVFQYNAATTLLEWDCFFRALDLAVNKFKDGRSEVANGFTGHDAHIPKPKMGNNVGGWRVLVALEVDVARVAAGLKPVNDDYLVGALDETDGEGRPIARATDDGKIVPCFHVAKVRRRKGESEDDYSRRVCEDVYYGKTGVY
jgi:hypothetical protein